jgi:glycosyltransferase involved in cell wall biosynthesis
MDDLVSVVIPTYNRVECLAAAVQSALDQTHKNVEVLIADDGSVDGTAELVQRNWGSDPRVRYFWQPNKGPSAARNLGLAAARGAFASFLDSDDLIAPWKFEVQLACLARYPAAVMVHSEIDTMDRGGKISSRRLSALLPYYQRTPVSRIYAESCTLGSFYPAAPEALRDARVYFGDVLSHQLLDNLIMVTTLLLRRNRVGEFIRFDESLRNEETYEYFLRVCSSGPVAFIDATTSTYQRGRQDHLWKAQEDQSPEFTHQLDLSYLHVLEVAYAREAGRFILDPRLLQHQLACAHLAIADSAICLGNRSSALQHLRRCVRLQLHQRRAWLQLIAALILPMDALRAVQKRLTRAAQVRRARAWG